MIQRDYVASKAIKKKKLSTKNKFIIITITALLLLGFGGGLFFLKKSTIEKGLVEKQGKNIVRTQEPVLPTKQEDGWNYIRSLETREVPTHNDPKRLDKIQNLTPEQKKILQQLERESSQLAPKGKNKKIEEVPVKENIVPAKENVELVKEEEIPNVKDIKNQFGVQCGAFSTLPQAEGIQSKLLMAGFGTQIKKGSNLYRVVIGPMATQAQANETSREAKKITECVIVKWQ